MTTSRYRTRPAYKVKPHVLTKMQALRAAGKSYDVVGPLCGVSAECNVYLNELDQHVKHALQVRHYIRYVDDFVLLDESPQWLNYARADIEAFLPDRLALQLNPRKTILQPLSRGVDFVGQVVKPWRRTIRRRTFNDALARVEALSASEKYKALQSYFGLFRQATHSHGDRTALANLARRLGYTVDHGLTKTYRKA